MREQTHLFRMDLLHLLSAILALSIVGISVSASNKITKSPFSYISVSMGVAAIAVAVLMQISKDLGYRGLGIGTWK